MQTSAESTAALFKDATSSFRDYQQIISGIPYEKKGILFSEMFYFWVLANSAKPNRILESGRARGQSTLILSKCFPECEIISVEYDKNSPDVEIASERLKECANVRQIFGDATKLLPEMAQKTDIALIDGPKGYRGVRLALRLLHSGLPMVFVHDTKLGSKERSFLNRRMPETLFSDNNEIALHTHQLDADISDDMDLAIRWTENGAPPNGYGFSLACLPSVAQQNYQRLLAHAVVDGFVARIFQK